MFKVFGIGKKQRSIQDAHVKSAQAEGFYCRRLIDLGVITTADVAEHRTYFVHTYVDLAALDDPFLIDTLHSSFDRGYSVPSPGEPSPGPNFISPKVVVRRISNYVLINSSTPEQRERLWALPKAHLLEVVKMFESDPARVITYDEIAQLVDEVARLTAPLWRTAEFPHPPDIAVRSFVRMCDATSNWVEPTKVYDERLSVYVERDTPALEEDLLSEMLASYIEYRKVHLQDHPKYGPLPHDPSQRLAEEQRRDAETRTLLAVAQGALDELIVPLEHAQRARLNVELEAAEKEVERRLSEITPLTPVRERPAPQPFGVSPKGAEQWVCEVLRWLGAAEVEVTQQTRDGGVDIVGDNFVVSVKHYSGSVSVVDVREIFGVATSLGKRATLWTSGALTADAATFADLAPVATVRYSVESGEWQPLNQEGFAFLKSLVGPREL